MNVVSLENLKKPFEAYCGDAPYLFVSYSHQDKEAVYIELVRLKKLGFNVWYDEGISPGSRWSDDLAERIANCALFLYYVTPRSVTSVNCQDEANYVLEAGNPFLAVHLEETELPPGLQLRMGSRQAILRYELEPDAYQSKLHTAIAAQAPELPRSDLTQGFRLGDFKVEPLTGNVIGPDGESHHLEPKVMDVFVHLAEHAGELVTRDQLLDAVWPGQVAADELLTRAVSELRRALGDTKNIETVPKRGYRLVGDIEPTEDGRPANVTVPASEVAASITAPGDIKVADTWKERRKIVPIGLLALATILVVAAIHQLRPVAPPPLVTGYTQLTKSQVFFPPLLSPLPLIADQSRIYFNTVDPDAGFMGVRQVSQAGGEATVIDVLSDDPGTQLVPMSMTPDASSLLLGSFSYDAMEKGSSDNGLWLWPVVGGNPRRIGDARAAGAYSPDGKTILYHFQSLMDIHIANADMTEGRMLAETPGHTHWARWSPDGKRIRFSAHSDDGFTNVLYEMSPDGSGRHRVLPSWDAVEHCCGSWTPDGRYFVFHAVHNGRTQLWAIAESHGLLGPRESEPVQITTGALDFRRASVAPDGERTFAIGWQLRGEVVRYDSRLDGFVALPGFETLSAEWLAYSPDESLVAYVSYPEGDLWRSNSDGSNRVQLTSAQMRVIEPLWSPDGETLVFTGQTPDQGFKIYVVPAKGGVTRRLTAGDAAEDYPTWSPHGKRLAFVDWSKDAIQLLDLESGSVTAIPGSDHLNSPKWSPDGQHFVAFHDSNLVLFTISTESVETLVPNAVFDGFGFYWASDGNHVYYHDGYYKGSKRSVRKVNIYDKTVETVATVGTTRAAWGVGGIWIGMAPDGSPITMRDLGIHHIYTLDWPPD